jgi:hypothetical protein
MVNCLCMDLEDSSKVFRVEAGDTVYKREALDKKIKYKISSHAHSSGSLSIQP